MKQEEPKGGRPGAVKVSDELLKRLKFYPFKKGSFIQTAHSMYSEAALKNVVKIISQKIWLYADKYPISDLDRKGEKNKDIIKSLRPKLKKMGLGAEIINARTLKRCLDIGKASQFTIDALEAFCQIYEEEKRGDNEKQKLLNRVAGLYHVMAVHYTRRGKFQRSLVGIDKDGHGFIKFMDRDYIVQKKALNMVELGKSNLLLTMENAVFPLIFYLYLGPEKGNNQNYPFYQSTFIYSNRAGNTIANLAVFERIHLKEGQEEASFIEGYEPSRQMESIEKEDDHQVDSDHSLTVRQSIQYFLLHHARPVATMLYDKILPFNFNKSVPVYPGSGSNPTQFYAETRKFSGDYFIYFNERFSSKTSGDKLLDKSDFFSTVGKGIVRIWADSITGVFKCEMKTRKNENDLIVHKGEVVNDKLGNDNYLILAMYSRPQNQRYISLLFRVINDNILIGGFNIAYSSLGQLGTGIVVMRKVREEKKEETGWDEPITILPSSYQPGDPFECTVVNLLSRNRVAITAPPSYSKLKPDYQDFRYWGVYYLYSHRIKEGYRKTVVVVAKNRAVKMKVVEGHEDYGEIEHRGNTLNITMRYKEKRGAGFYCIRVDGVAPRENHSCYRGAFAGIYPAGDETPIASQFLMEFKGRGEKVKELWDAFDKKEAARIPEKVKQALGPESVLFVEENIYSFKQL